MSEEREHPDESDRAPRPLWWRVVKVFLGTVLLLLGVAGLFLPLLQGVLFILLALAILSTESRRLREFRERLRQRHPELWEKADAFKERGLAWWNRGRTRVAVWWSARSCPPQGGDSA